MIRTTRFWIAVAVFQVFFGLAVFAITRHLYMQDTQASSAGPPRKMASEWPDLSSQGDLENSISLFTQPAEMDDPAALSRQADESFNAQQYDRAAVLYERLLAVDPGQVDTYNNLGITLHYLGRSAEALVVLNEGVAVDPAYQRIWLTLGYVNAQTGHVEQARSALTKAVQMGTGTDVGQSAKQMLDTL